MDLQGSVAVVTAARWLVIGTPDASKQTVDGGASWQPYPTDYSQAAPVAPEIVFGDAQIGYATVRGAIQRRTYFSITFAIRQRSAAAGGEEPGRAASRPPVRLDLKEFTA